MLEIIKKLCKEKGISVYQLEEILGFGHNTIYQWNKRVPGIDKINSVADYFNVSSDYLLGRTKNPSLPLEDSNNIGQNIISHFRLNTSDMDIDDIEELEKELIDFQDLLIKKAKERKARNKKD